MSEPKSIVNYSYSMSEYGRVRVKLAKLLEDRGITRNRLCKLTGTKYGIIDRYFKAEQVERVDLDFLAKVCYTLDCKIEDILEYEEPEKE